MMRPSTTRLIFRYVCPLLALIAAPQGVRAQEQIRRAGQPADSTAIQLPAIEVVASILGGARPGVGSGVPARTSILAGTAVRSMAPRVLSDALVGEAGISLYDDLGSPYKATLVMRGFAASPVVGLPQGVSIFIDGVPVNEPDAGQTNFDLLPLRHIARVEVLSGTASLLGPHSLGGAVNVVTRGGEGPLGGEAELTAGSHGSYSAAASVGGSTGDWSYYAGSAYGRDAGWRQRTSATLYDVLVNLSRSGERGGIRMQAFAARSNAETAGSLPLSVYTVQPDSNLSAGDFEDLSQVHVAASGHAPVAGGRGSFHAYVRGHDAERFNVNQIHDPDVRSFSENRTLGAQADWRWGGRTADRSLSLRLGAGGSVNSVSVQIFAERIDPGLTTHVESPISDVGAYGVVDYGRGPVTVSAGLRADAVRIPFRNRLDPERDTTNLFLRLSPRAGVHVAVGRGLSLYASAGQSFRAPAVIELACADPENPCPLPFALGDDPPLDPVVARTYEVGGQWVRRRLSMSLAAYDTRVRDDIFLFPYHDETEPEGSTIDGFFANIDQTRRAGAEADLRLTTTGGHSAYLNYALTRATFEVNGVELFSIREETGGENEIGRGDRFPLVPAYTARAGALLRLTRSVQLGLDARFTGRRWLRGDEANEEEPLDPYALTDLRLGYRLGTWEVSALAENVFDFRYAAFGTFNLNQGAGGILERFLTPGQPRTYRFMVRREFGR